MAKNWTEEEEEHIRRSFLTQTYGELAEHFGVTTKAMESKIRRMGLKKQELLAETADPLEIEPVVSIVEEPPLQEDLSPTPIESIHKLQRRIEVIEETKEARLARLKVTREAAETEKARREESRTSAPMAAALKKFESGVKKLASGKSADAAKIFQAILDDPPPDHGLVMRIRQYLAATENTGGAAKDPKTIDDMYNHAVVLVNDGDYAAALETLERAAKKASGDDRISYVQAVAYALSGDDDAAVAALGAAIKAKDVNRIYARNDSDFASLHALEAFQEIIASPDSDADAEDPA